MMTEDSHWAVASTTVGPCDPQYAVEAYSMRLVKQHAFIQQLAVLPEAIDVQYA